MLLIEQNLLAAKRLHQGNRPVLQPCSFGSRIAREPTLLVNINV
ncbi:hypothetical protein TGS27_1848 [Geobacillus stearothermophilus]|uniref:Uncharacterized protein n=1 Tax=Geobacillus stearothermophilus TaxID=1422 RepID=A0A150MTA3_GEOSE|nr:hypothetical protein GS8_1436 [Geobacillus stearothermophilus]KYD27707.1 hypothetical protein B4109_0107 [Geobacillus stearothermophilus]KYD31879.1 hypothetical protein B4114_0101 [Geobacillus stearothermophilus]OAO80687.1 hypothetical protein TGS27_1848 [Geobacillus stearothermophilus]